MIRWILCVFYGNSLAKHNGVRLNQFAVVSAHTRADCVFVRVCGPDTGARRRSCAKEHFSVQIGFIEIFYRSQDGRSVFGSIRDDAIVTGTIRGVSRTHARGIVARLQNPPHFSAQSSALRAVQSGEHSRRRGQNPRFGSARLGSD